MNRDDFYEKLQKLFMVMSILSLGVITLALSVLIACLVWHTIFNL
jgi:hypothetical protein